MTTLKTRQAIDSIGWVRRMIEQGQTMIPEFLVSQIIQFIVLPDSLSSDQADHNIDRLLSLATQAANDDLEPFNPGKPLGDRHTRFVISKAELRAFAKLVAEHSRNQIAE